MAKSTKKQQSFSELMKSISHLLEDVHDAKVELRREIRKTETKFCKDHPTRIVYIGIRCKECYEEYANLKVKERSERDPWIGTDGYKRVVDSDGKPLYYHRVLAEEFIGRPLRSDEQVSFINDDRSDCSLGNLAIKTKIPLQEYVQRFIEQTNL